MNDAITLLSTKPPEFSEAAVTPFLKENYGVEGALKTLVSERDQNFLVEPESGDSFVFKIASSAEVAGVTDFQVEALLHIEENSPELLVPRVVRTLSGDTSFTIVGEDGREHVARLLTWLEGVPLRYAEPKPNNAEDRGLFLGNLGVALADFDHPFSDHVLLWDLSHAGQLAILLDNIESETLRESCQGRLRRFEEHTQPELLQLRSQVIYNDLNSSNLLVDPYDTETITGIIDFGDMVKSPLVIDVAVAAAYLCDAGDDPLSGIVKFLSGYSRVRPLQQEEVALLFDLILTRNTMTIVITHWRAADHPENREYILRNEPRARSTIDALTAMGREHVTDVFLKACRL